MTTGLRLRPQAHDTYGIRVDFWGCLDVRILDDWLLSPLKILISRQPDNEIRPILMTHLFLASTNPMPTGTAVPMPCRTDLDQS